MKSNHGTSSKIMHDFSRKTMNLKALYGISFVRNFYQDQSGSYGFEIGWASHTEPNYWVGKTYSFAQNLPNFLAIFKLLGGQLPTLPPHNYPTAINPLKMELQKC